MSVLISIIMKYRHSTTSLLHVHQNVTLLKLLVDNHLWKRTFESSSCAFASVNCNQTRRANSVSYTKCLTPSVKGGLFSPPLRTSKLHLLCSRTNCINNQQRHFSDFTVPSWAVPIVQAFAGCFKTLSESTPAAYSQQLFQFVHDSTGLPWWASIILTTVAARSVVTLPLALYQVRKSVLQFVLASFSMFMGIVHLYVTNSIREESNRKIAPLVYCGICLGGCLE